MGGVDELSLMLEDNTTDAQSIPMSDGELENFGELAQAITRKLSVRIYYTNIGYERGVYHEVFPVQIKERDGLWYLLAYDYHYKARRVFALSRMEEVEVSEAKHPTVDEETIRSIQNHGNFSIWDDPTKKVETIKVRLFGYAAWYIQERKIHKSQRHEIISKDEVLLTLKTGDLLGVKLWLRRFMPEVEVLKPRHFRDAFINDLRCALSRYENKE